MDIPATNPQHQHHPHRPPPSLTPVTDAASRILPFLTPTAWKPRTKTTLLSFLIAVIASTLAAIYVAALLQARRPSHRP
jgi:hypothetical protein